MLPAQSSDAKVRASELQRSNVIQVVRSSAQPLHAGAISPLSFPTHASAAPLGLGCDASSPTHAGYASAAQSVARTWPLAASPQFLPHAQLELAGRAPPPVETAVPADAYVMMDMEPGGLGDLSVAHQLSLLQNPSVSLSSGFNELDLDDPPTFDVSGSHSQGGAHLAAGVQYAHLGGEQASVLTALDPLGVGGQSLFFKQEGHLLDTHLEPLLISTTQDMFVSPLASADDVLLSPAGAYSYPLAFDATGGGLEYSTSGATFFATQDGPQTLVADLLAQPQQQESLQQQQQQQQQQTLVFSKVNGAVSSGQMQVHAQTEAAATSASAPAVTGRRYITRRSGRLSQSGAATGSPSVDTGGSLSSHATSVSGVRHTALIVLTCVILIDSPSRPKQFRQ